MTSISSKNLIIAGVAALAVGIVVVAVISRPQGEPIGELTQVIWE